VHRRGRITAGGKDSHPLNPKASTAEITHVVADSEPDAVVIAAGSALRKQFSGRRVIEVERRAACAAVFEKPDAEAPALILYTSGTSGKPKGVVIPYRAIATNLDALAQVWRWTEEDVVVHSLPLFHAHGLVVGVFGALRLGGSVRHGVRFEPEAVGCEIAEGGTMVFAVPTMYYRIAETAERRPELGQVLSRARLLVSGSAALPVRDHRRIERLCGQRIVERYGLTETLMNCSTPADGDRRAGYVGRPLPGVELKLVADDGTTIQSHDDETFGEVAVRGPNLFSGYLHNAEATAAAFDKGWFMTGDLATRTDDGYFRLVGRRSSDLIKTGGFKVGAGEVEAVLLEHEAVVEAAVAGVPDQEYGERITAWVVVRIGSHVTAKTLADHAAAHLARPKRPREIRLVRTLPRNEMGKVVKQSRGDIGNRRRARDRRPCLFGREPTSRDTRRGRSTPAPTRPRANARIAGTCPRFAGFRRHGSRGTAIEPAGSDLPCAHGKPPHRSWRT
jgi:malonyl-CoA/methylmalonyl-CoA synthetase